MQWHVLQNSEREVYYIEPNSSSRKQAAIIPEKTRCFFVLDCIELLLQTGLKGKFGNPDLNDRFQA